jgi:hypothetical protein
MFEFLKVSSPSSRSRFTLLTSIPKVCFLAAAICIPLSAFAQGSPLDNGFTATQTLFTGTIAKVASLIAIELDTPKPCEDVGRKHSDPGAGGRVFKSLHKPLIYLGVERTVFYFVCVGLRLIHGTLWHDTAYFCVVLEVAWNFSK